MITQEQAEAIAAYYINAIDAQRENVSEKTKISAKEFLNWLALRQADNPEPFCDIVKNKTPDAVSKWSNDDILAEWYIRRTNQLWGIDVYPEDKRYVFIIREKDLTNMPIVVLEKVEG